MCKTCASSVGKLLKSLLAVHKDCSILHSQDKIGGESARNTPLPHILLLIGFPRLF